MAGHLQATGAWDAIQDNGFTAHFDIRLTGASHPEGGLEIDGGDRCSHSDGTVRSTAASGRVFNDRFEFKVTWAPQGNLRTEGLYEGFLRRDGTDIGLITGDTRDLLHPGSHAGWKSSRNFPL
jgi:hypothetical protein